MSKKQKKIFKTIVIVLVIILIAEIIYFGFRYYKIRKESTYYTVVNSLILTDDGYTGVGLSDYRYSNFNEYDKGYQKATLFVNKDEEIIKEVTVDLGYNSFFNDIVKTSDGYIAVGAIEMTKEQAEEKTSEGLIVKYDKNFKEVWRKNVNELGKTELFKVKLDKDENIIIAGTSVYGSGYMGNHKTGGGMLFKYDSAGKEIFRINNGGPYQGRFNDLIVESDGYVVVGLGKANSGIIIKYDTKGKKVWSSSYGYTDEKGILAVDKLGNNYVTATTKVVSKEDLSNYQAALVMFDKNGKKIDDVKYSDNKVNGFADVKVIDDTIIVCGYTGKKTQNELKSDAIVIKYDKYLYEEESSKIEGENNDIYSSIYQKDDSIYLLGYSNSKLEDFDKLNGYDYFPILKKYDSDLK